MSATGPACGTWRQVIETGRWILHAPHVRALIVTGLCLDSFVRIFLTFASTYYRWIALPDWSFGLLGSAFAVISFGLQPVAQRMAEGCSVKFNLGVAAALVLGGLTGCALGWRWWGLIFALALGAAMTLLGFFLSYYLNHWTDSARRATVLSFKGMAFNLSYGAAGMGFALLLRGMGSGGTALAEMDRFGTALRWLPPFFVLAWMAARMAGDLKEKEAAVKN
jgi:hypothetical protein